MSSTSTKRNFSAPLLWKYLQRFGSALIVIGIAILGFLGSHFLLPNSEQSHEASSESESAKTTIVEISSSKMAASDLKTLVIIPTTFAPNITVPGKIVFDPTQTVHVRATSTCRVKKLLVQPNQTVSLGEPLMIMSGTEVGAARNEIARCANSVELLEKELAWTQDTHRNINALLELLKQQPAPELIEEKFKDKNLGEHRNELLSAYSALLLAEKKAKRIQGLLQSGAISGRVADTRRAELDSAKAKFNGIREEMQFQLKQGLREAEIALETEQRAHEICVKKLTLLTGDDSDVAQKSLGTDFQILSPTNGQVVEWNATEAGRFEPGELVVTISDTKNLWVEAQISQSDLGRIRVSKGNELAFRLPSQPDKVFEANVLYVGSSVSPDTMSIPIVAQTNNDEMMLRRGMSVTVDIPTSDPYTAIAIPVGAIQRIEMSPVVFVRVGQTAFEARPVIVGAKSNGLIEVAEGVSAGDEIVVDAAFILKSELLLSEEE